MWAVQLAAGTAAVPATATWGTTTVPLRWADAQNGAGGWRVELTGLRGAAGPTPGLPPGALSSDLDVISTDSRFRSYDYAPH